MVKMASIYTERINKIYVVGAGWVVKGFFKVLYPFMPENTKRKITFVSVDELHAALRMPAD